MEIQLSDDEIGFPEWASTPHPTDGQFRPEWYEAVAMVERASRILNPDEEAIYTGQRLGECAAMALLDFMQNSRGGSMYDRVRLTAQVMELYAKRRGAGRRVAPFAEDDPLDPPP